MSSSLHDLQGRTALVTGGSRGIGAAIVRQLAREGAAVAVGYARTADAARALVDELRAGGGRADAFAADLRSADAAAGLAVAVERALGPVDVLVANAGIFRSQKLDEVTPDDFDETLAINLRAPFVLAQRVVPGMRERRFGRILFTSSVAAYTGGIVGPHYAASKAGLHGLVHFLARRLAAHGITVNAIAPALIADTGDGSLSAAGDQLRQTIPLGRFGTPAEVADLAVAMLRNGYLTNQTVSLDGGIHPH